MVVEQKPVSQDEELERRGMFPRKETTHQACCLLSWTVMFYSFQPHGL